MKTFKTTLLTTVLALGMTVGDAAFAIGRDNCTGFRIQVVNASGAPVKVTKLEYRDYDVNVLRSEAIGNRRINPNTSHTWTRNLQRVDNDLTNLTITYREKRAYQAGYHPARTVSSGRFVCRDNGIRTVRID
jgi:hypothetical protein